MEKDLGDLKEPALAFLPSCWACTLSLGGGNDGSLRPLLPHSPSSESSAPSSSSSSSTAWSGASSGGRYVVASAPAGPGRQHAPPLVEGVLGLGDLLGGRLRGGLAQARERLGLARVEIRQAPPATEPIRSVHRIQTRDRLKQRRKCIATTNQLLPGRF
jgi:hypothetical protein